MSLYEELEELPTGLVLSGSRGSESTQFIVYCCGRQISLQKSSMVQEPFHWAEVCLQQAAMAKEEEVVACRGEQSTKPKLSS